MNKKVMVLFVMCSLILPTALFANGQNEKEDGMIKIGAAMADSSDKWLSYLEDGVRAFGDEMADVEIVMTDGKSDAAIQLNSVETLLIQGVDAIVIVPVDISAMSPIANACKEAGVPMIVVNRLPGDEIMAMENAYYVGSESIQAGILQAEWVAEKLGTAGGNVAIMTGRSGHEAAIMRTQGNEDVFAKNSNTKIITTAEGKWDRALGMQIAENWFQNDDGLVAILANNDEMAIGAVLAAQGLGIADEDIIIAGVDATPDAVEYIGKGLDVTVFQSAHGQGFGGAETAYKILMGESVEKIVWIPYVVVDINNKDNF